MPFSKIPQIVIDARVGSKTGKPAVLLVLRGDWQSASRLPLVFRRAGCHVTVLAWENSYFRRARFVDRFIGTPRSMGALMQALKQHLLQTGDNYAKVVLGDEYMTEQLALRREEGWAARCLPVAPTAVRLDRIRFKTKFLEACAGSNIRVPTGRTCRSLADTRSAAEQIGYPVVLKRPTGVAGEGVRVVHRANQLEAAYHSLPPDIELVVQKFVPGRTGLTEMVCAAGQPLAWVSSYKRVSWPGSIGPSCVREYTCHPHIEELVREIGNLTGLDGLCGFDWIHSSEDDSIYVIELHARATSGFHLGRACGVDFSTAFRALIDGDGAVQTPHAPGRRGKIVFLYPQFWQRCLALRDWNGLLYLLPGIVNTDIPWSDPYLLLKIMPRGRLVARLIDLLRGLRSKVSRNTM